IRLRRSNVDLTSRLGGELGLRWKMFFEVGIELIQVADVAHPELTKTVHGQGGDAYGLARNADLAELILERVACSEIPRREFLVARKEPIRIDLICPFFEEMGQRGRHAERFGAAGNMDFALCEVAVGNGQFEHF